MTKRWTATKSNIQPKRLASKRRRAALADDGIDGKKLIAYVRATKDERAQRINRMMDELDGPWPEATAIKLAADLFRRSRTPESCEMWSDLSTDGQLVWIAAAYRALDGVSDLIGRPALAALLTGKAMVLPRKHGGKAGPTHEMHDAYRKGEDAAASKGRGFYESFNAGYNAMVEMSPYYWNKGLLDRAAAKAKKMSDWFKANPPKQEP